MWLQALHEYPLLYEAELLEAIAIAYKSTVATIAPFHPGIPPWNKVVVPTEFHQEADPPFPSKTADESEDFPNPVNCPPVPA